MTKYDFPFDAVRRVRALQRDEQRQRLADAFRAQDIVEQQQQQLGTELAALQNQQREDLSRENLNVNDLLAAQRYELVLNVQQQTLEKQSALLAEEAERRRQSLVEAERGVQVLKKLDDRLRDAHQAEEQRTETKQLDEVAQQRAMSHLR